MHLLSSTIYIHSMCMHIDNISITTSRRNVTGNVSGLVWGIHPQLRWGEWQCIQTGINWYTIHALIISSYYYIYIIHLNINAQSYDILLWYTSVFWMKVVMIVKPSSSYETTRYFLPSPPRTLRADASEFVPKAVQLQLLTFLLKHRAESCLLHWSKVPETTTTRT